MRRLHDTDAALRRQVRLSLVPTVLASLARWLKTDFEERLVSFRLL